MLNDGVIRMNQPQSLAQYWLDLYIAELKEHTVDVADEFCCSPSSRTPIMPLRSVDENIAFLCDECKQRYLDRLNAAEAGAPKLDV